MILFLQKMQDMAEIRHVTECFAEIPRGRFLLRLVILNAPAVRTLNLAESGFR